MRVLGEKEAGRPPSRETKRTPHEGDQQLSQDADGYGSALLLDNTHCLPPARLVPRGICKLMPCPIFSAGFRNSLLQNQNAVFLIFGPVFVLRLAASGGAFGRPLFWRDP